MRLPASMPGRRRLYPACALLVSAACLAAGGCGNPPSGTAAAPPASPAPAAAPPGAPPAGAAVSPGGMPGPMPGAGAPAQPDLTAMRQQVESTVAQRPKDYAVRMQAATFYTRIEDHEGALRHLKAATQLSPKQVIPWVALGDTATLARQFAAAEQAYRRAEALQPGNPLAARGRAQLLISQGKLEPARAVLERAVQSNPRSGELRVALGNLYLLLSRPRRTIEILQPVVKDAPQHIEARLLLADAYDEDKQLEKAVEQVEAVVGANPAVDQAWGRLGLYRLRQARYRDARPPLERAIEINPQESHYYATLGDAHALDTTDPAGRDQCIPLYQRALELDPKNDKAIYSYAMARTRRGQPEDLREAADLLERLLKIGGNEVNVHFKLAETYRRLGEQARAGEHLAKFRQLSAAQRAKNRDKYRAITFEDTAESHLALARKALAAGDYTLAETEFQLALERNPDLPGARHGLEEARSRAGSGSRR